MDAFLKNRMASSHNKKARLNYIVYIDPYLDMQKSKYIHVKLESTLVTIFRILCNPFKLKLELYNEKNKLSTNMLMTEKYKGKKPLNIHS